MTSQNESQKKNNTRNQLLIENIISDLKNRELVNYKRIIILGHSDRPFTCDIIFRRIVYDCSFNIPEDPNYLRYYFLHEEGHMTQFQYRFLLYFFMGIEIIGMAYFLISDVIINPIARILLPISTCFILLFVTYRFFYPLLRMDELNADKFGAVLLKEKFGVNKPSQIILNALNFNFFENEGIPSTSWLKNLENKVFRFIYGYYPTNDERASYIHESVD